MTIKFLRADTFRYKRIGKNRKKLQKWRRPRGKHNKLRLKRTGHSKCPGVGYKTEKKLSGKIQNLMPVTVNNMKELESLTKNNIAILSRKLGARKKLELIKKAEEKSIKIFNMGAKK